MEPRSHEIRICFRHYAIAPESNETRTARIAPALVSLIARGILVALAAFAIGVGLRTGASVGYMRYTRKKTLNPL